MAYPASRDAAPNLAISYKKLFNRNAHNFWT